MMIEHVVPQIAKNPVDNLYFVLKLELMDLIDGKKMKNKQWYLNVLFASLIAGLL